MGQPMPGGRSRRRRPARRPMPAAQAGPVGQVVIGIDTVYSVLIEVRDTVADLAADMDDQADDIGELKKQNVALSDRVTKLESWMWRAAGAAAILGAVASPLVGKLFGPAT